MIFKKRFFIIGLLVMLLGISVVSASENISDELSINTNLDGLDSVEGDSYLSNVENNNGDIASFNNEDILNNDVNKEDNLSVSSAEEIVSETETPEIEISKTNLYYEDYYGIDVKVKVKEKANYFYPNAPIEYSIVPYGNSPEYEEATTNSHGVIVVDTYDLDCGKYTLHVKFWNTYVNKTITINKTPIKIITKTTINADNKHYFTIKVDVDSTVGYNEDPSVYFTVNGKTYVIDYSGDSYTLKLKLSAAKTYDFLVSLSFSDKYYKYTPVKGKIIVKKFNVKITAKSFAGFKGKYSTLKAIIKDSNGKKISEGIVKFKINGKTYKVKVKNGVAKKKIKLSKIKTYKYKATYSSKLIKSKTSKAKVVVKKIPTFKVKIGKYKITIKYKDYKKIRKAADGDGSFHKQYFTGKYKTYKYYKDKKVTLTKKKLWMDDTPTTQKTYHDAWNTPSGYTFKGYETKKVGSHTKTYMVYKKNTYKKVLTKTPKTKVYIVVESDGWWGSTAQLYYLKYVHKDKYGYKDYEWHLGKSKSIF